MKHLLTLLVLPASLAVAQSAPISQVRTTRVFTTTHTAPDFNPFSDTNTSASGGNFTVQSAVQDSSLTPAVIHVDVHFTWNTTGPTVHTIDVSSRCAYVFTITSPVTYQAIGQSRAMVGIGSGTSVGQLVGPTGVVFTADGNAPVPLPFSFSGALVPGQYSYTATSETSGSTQIGGASGQGGVDLTITFYCPADFNHDATVDFFDYLDFVNAFAASAHAADFNHDGTIDYFDYLDFVNAFSTPC